MKIKRYIAPDVRQAIGMVREELGPDAVILSNRRVAKGVEVMAAVEYDEAAVRKMGSEAPARELAATERRNPDARRSVPPTTRLTPIKPSAEPVDLSDFFAPAEESDDRNAATGGAEPADFNDFLRRNSRRSRVTDDYDYDSAAPAARSVRGDQEERVGGGLDRYFSRSAPARAGEESDLFNRERFSTETAAELEGSAGYNNFDFDAESSADDEAEWLQPNSRSAAKGGSPLDAMQEEIHTLRSMLENQLSSLAWRDNQQKNPMRGQLLQRLLQLGLSNKLCNAIADRINYSRDATHNWRQALGMLARQLPVTADDIVSHGGIIAVVGPTGVGKTTTVAKLAARYALRHGTENIALITTDSYRIGAQQQLRTFGRILGVPVYLANDGEELKKLVAQLRDKSLVLIDTAGMSQRDVQLSRQFRMLQDHVRGIRTYAVLSTTAQRSVLEETVRAFNRSELDGCILTKVDETAGLGEALSVVVQQQLPVAYISDGQRVPEDLHPARANNLVTRSVTLMQKHAEAPGDEEMSLAFGQMVSNVHG